MQAAFITHHGGRSENQDNALLLPEYGIFAVADGVGGGQRGEVASATLLYHLRSAIVAGENIEKAVQAAHASLLRESESTESYSATTLVLLELKEGLANVYWVGDSRAYQLLDNALRCVSRDHSAMEQLPGQQGLRQVLTQAVGVAGEEGLLVEKISLPRHGEAQWLLCSDGLYNLFSQEALKAVMLSGDSIRASAENLLHAALEIGPTDNVTFILLSDKGDWQGFSVSQEDRLAPQHQKASSHHFESKHLAFVVLGGLLALLSFWFLMRGL